MVLQVMPRLGRSPGGLVDLVVPLMGALAGSWLIAALGGRGWRAGAVVGAASQLPAAPSYVDQVGGLLAAGYLLDTAFVTSLLYAYVSLGALGGAAVAASATGTAEPAAGLWTDVTLLVAALALLAASLGAMTLGSAPWGSVVTLSLAAGGHCWALRATGAAWVRTPAAVLLAACAGIGAFALAVIVFSFLAAR